MGLFSTHTLYTLDDLLLLQIQTLYDAEQRLARSLPRMAEAASGNRLIAALNHQIRETERQVARLEVLFQVIGMTAETETCEATKALIAECDQVIKADGEPEIKDAALIAVAKRVTHNQIAAYSSARTCASQAGFEQIAVLLSESHTEERAADEKFTELADASFQTPSMRPVESPSRGTPSMPKRSSMLR